MENLINVCAYCRVSTDSKDQENSYENQKSYFNRELNKKEGYNLVEIYADKGLSGTSFRNRDSFNQMLRDAGLDMKTVKSNITTIENKNIKTVYVPSDRKPKFKYIFVKNSSRFARNIEVMGILRSLKDKGVYVHFLDINKTTENEADEMLLQMLFMLDENESKDKSRKVKFGAEESAKKGVIRVGKELFGYYYNKEENTLRIIDEEVDVVKLIFCLAEQNMGARQICNELRDRNIKTRRNVEFRSNVILRMLQNPIYTGKVVRNKWDCKSLFGNSSRVLKPQEEWIVQESDRIDKIIEEEQFNKVQELIKQRTNKSSKKGVYVGRDEFARKIKCGCCKNFYTKNSEIRKLKDSSYKKVFYNCGLKKVKGVNACNSRNVHQEELDETIQYWCDGHFYSWLSRNINILLEELDKQKETIINNFTKKDSDCSQQEERLKELEVEMKLLVDKYLENSSETLKKILDNKINSLEAKIKEIENEINIIKSDDANIKQTIENIDIFKQFIKDDLSRIPKTFSREKFLDNVIYFTVKENSISVFTKYHYMLSTLKTISNVEYFNKIKKYLKDEDLEKIIYFKKKIEL